MSELGFLLIAIAVIAALAGGYLKQHWPIAVGVVLLAISLLVMKGGKL